MKTAELITTFTTAAVLIIGVGCDNGAPTSSIDSTSAEADVKMERMQQENREAAEATREYLYAQKAEYGAMIRMQLAELNQEIDELSIKAQNATEETRAKVAAKVADLREQTVRLGEELNSMPDVTESTWEDFKDGVKSGYEEVKDSLEDARDWVVDKVDS